MLAPYVQETISLHGVARRLNLFQCSWLKIIIAQMEVVWCVVTKTKKAQELDVILSRQVIADISNIESF